MLLAAVSDILFSFLAGGTGQKRNKRLAQVGKSLSASGRFPGQGIGARGSERRERGEVPSMDGSEAVAVVWWRWYLMDVRIYRWLQWTNFMPRLLVQYSNSSHLGNAAQRRSYLAPMI